MPPYASLYVWTLLYVWMPLYAWTPHICLDACLDDAWMTHVHTQHKERMLVRLRGCPYAPIHLDAPVHTQHKKHALSG